MTELQSKKARRRIPSKTLPTLKERALTIRQRLLTRASPHVGTSLQQMLQGLPYQLLIAFPVSWPQ